MVFRCPNIQEHYNEAVLCLNFGTPENNEFTRCLFLKRKQMSPPPSPTCPHPHPYPNPTHPIPHQNLDGVMVIIILCTSYYFCKNICQGL